MSDQRSFTRFENELLHAYRRHIAAAQSTDEVRRQFARTVCELLEKAGGVRCRHEDVVLRPAEAPGYTLGDDITAQAVFRDLLRDSDLAAILARLAEPAVHRHAHLARHPEKTNTNHYIHH